MPKNHVPRRLNVSKNNGFSGAFRQGAQAPSCWSAYCEAPLLAANCSSANNSDPHTGAKWLMTAVPSGKMPGRSFPKHKKTCCVRVIGLDKLWMLRSTRQNLKGVNFWELSSATSERHGVDHPRLFWLETEWERQTANKHHTARWGTTKYRIPCAPGGLQPHTANPVASTKCFLAGNFWLWMARITASSKEAWAPPSLQHIWKILSGWTPSFSTIFRSSTLLSWYHFRSWTTFICRMNLS